jgi:UbiD family decarboxylase
MADLRTWLDDVDKIGQLMMVDGVDWDLELLTLAEIINERSKNRPALLFDRIKDHSEGYRVAANLVSSVDRLALTLGMEPGLGDLDFIENWRRKVKEIVPVDAETVSDGSIFEAVHRYSAARLERAP